MWIYFGSKNVSFLARKFLNWHQIFQNSQNFSIFQMFSFYPNFLEIFKNNVGFSNIIRKFRNIYDPNFFKFPKSKLALI